MSQLIEQAPQLAVLFLAALLGAVWVRALRVSRLAARVLDTFVFVQLVLLGLVLFADPGSNRSALMAVLCTGSVIWHVACLPIGLLLALIARLRERAAERPSVDTI